MTLIRCRFWFHSARVSCRLDFIKITLYLRKPLRIRPGQYVDLWTPSSIGSIFQSHPMTVASWSSDPQELLILYAQVQEGFTRKLLQQVEYGDTTSIAMFTGPHGVTLPLDSYDQVLLIATDLGVVALLPYMQYLAYKSHFIESRTKRVHLVWRLKSWSLIQVLASLLNAALEEDEPKENVREGTFSRILESVISISIYGEGHETSSDEKALKSLEKSSRVDLKRGQWNLRAVVKKDTVSSDFSLGQSEKPSAIAASVSPDVRAELNDVIKTSIQHVDLMYTDYQPEG
ncbi:Ferric/cupric reductase transmembrane component B [Fusarium oxysporum f. sp. rapae]|uniref:Ferric/cupric reductase transmembrane component B n=1 Tax=Fusarium oxysporum f. sp. rapae TaxID=485398 RepID=A0A8J5NH50_FUSOX|nr:Ferric/cupric reductase transmembrane component B [Fusarium oxysporum f. sp. rapae]